ncbi:hypothetical protein F4809DRAFT_628672 [Biscogniauxia mediterranea]|nr:hypothetical protein F4809DRAFT_628672 [Biscogniauxia mediterranea]
MVIAWGILLEVGVVVLRPPLVVRVYGDGVVVVVLVVIGMAEILVLTMSEARVGGVVRYDVMKGTIISTTVTMRLGVFPSRTGVWTL